MKMILLGWRGLGKLLLISFIVTGAVLLFLNLVLETEAVGAPAIESVFHSGVTIFEGDVVTRGEMNNVHDGWSARINWPHSTTARERGIFAIFRGTFGLIEGGIPEPNKNYSIRHRTWAAGVQSIGDRFSIAPLGSADNTSSLYTVLIADYETNVLDEEVALWFASGGLEGRAPRAYALLSFNYEAVSIPTLYEDGLLRLRHGGQLILPDSRVERSLFFQNPFWDFRINWPHGVEDNRAMLGVFVGSPGDYETKVLLTGVDFALNLQRWTEGPTTIGKHLGVIELGDPNRGPAHYTTFVIERDPKAGPFDHYNDVLWLASGGARSTPPRAYSFFEFDVIDNKAPTIENLSQYLIFGAEAIPEGDMFVGNTAVFKADLSDSDSESVQLEVEVKPFGTPFDGTNTVISEAASTTPGLRAEVEIDDLIPKEQTYEPGGNHEQFHWRARAVDSDGKASDWIEFGTEGDIDFEVKVVPLFTQVQSEFPSDARTLIWSQETYGSKPNPTCLDENKDSTIARCGCVIASLSMLAYYYGIRSGIDDTEIDPLAMNSWMISNDGYINGGSVNWLKAIEYLGLVENGVKKKRLSLDHHKTAVRSTIDQYVKNEHKPAIVYSNSHGHYFIADNKVDHPTLTSTYTVRDSFWFNTKTLADERDPANNIQSYQNTFNRAELFSYLDLPQKITSELYLYLASPAELLVTDSQGRKLGKDPRTGEAFNEIPDGSYVLEEPVASSDEPLDPSELHPLKSVRIPDPLSEAYDIEVIGTGEGSYALSALVYDDNGNSNTYELKGATTPNQVTPYELTLSSENVEQTNLELGYEALSAQKLIALLIEKVETSALSVYKKQPITARLKVQQSLLGYIRPPTLLIQRHLDVIFEHFILRLVPEFLSEAEANDWKQIIDVLKSKI